MATSEPPDIDDLIAELEAKLGAYRRAGSTPAERNEYTAAAHWAAPHLIAEIKRLRGFE
jgi:hypothetical protein